MAHRIKQLMNSAKLRRCVTCNGDKRATNGMVCDACAGTGYQSHAHTPPTVEAMVRYIELLEHYAIEQQAGFRQSKDKAIALEKDNLRRNVDNATLRRLLATIYCPPPMLYFDDSELQDNRAMPCIDFARDDPDDIHNKMIQRTMRGFNPATLRAASGKSDGAE